MTTTTLAAASGFKRGTLPVMAFACGVMVGNIYLCQPLLDEIARGFGVPEHLAGTVAVAAQIGYALGILLIVPLADMSDPRRLVRILMAVTTAGLLCAAISPTIPSLVIATLVVAAATVVPQILIPLAASLSVPERRGRVIGTLQTGLILGILLSRTVSGGLASFSGTWRTPYAAAAVLTALLYLILPRFMPEHIPTRSRQNYLVLLRSLPALLVHRPLLVSSGLGFCVFAAFSAFWSTLAFHLATPAFGLGAAATGLFGLWGAPGAMLAPMGGRLADRFGPNKVNACALACAAASFMIAGTLGSTSVLALVVTVNLLDFGLQSGQVANQARIFALGDGQRARLNTIYMVAVFGGGAIGSLVATLAWTTAGWTGVCAVSGLFVSGAALILAVAAVQGRRRI